MLKIEGCGTALITPFTTSGEVDFNALRKLIKRQLDGGINFLVPLGTTGETPCLEDEEKTKILTIVKEVTEGKIPVVAGAGSNCTKTVLKNIELLDRYGADAFLVVVPYYNKPTQQGIYDHFKTVASGTDKPVILYNVPGRTGVNMTAETTIRLSSVTNIIAVKEASGNMDQAMEIIRNAPAGFRVLSGNDDNTLEIMSAGGSGVISVASNVMPELVVRLTKLLKSGRLQEAKMLNDNLMPLFKNCFTESNPIPVKGALFSLGLISNILRLPLTSALPQTIDIMKKTIDDLKTL